MTTEVEITLPKLGESIVSATVVRWFKAEGEAIALDEPILEVSTDKVNSEIPSPVAGVLKQIVVPKDKEVEVGGLLAIVLTGDLLKEDTPTAPEEKPEILTTDKACFFSPAVLRLAQEKNLSMQELATMPKTGEGGRLTKKDVERYFQVKPTLTEGVDHLPMTPLRKAIAQNMVRSFYEAPHASLMLRIDVTELVQRIQKEKEAFLKEHGVKLSITSFMAEAIAKATKSYPLINASLENETIVVKRFVNLGVAVSVEQGVMVPVIQSCQSLSLPEIAKQVASFAKKAKEGTLNLEETQGGSITMTNFGMTGVMMGTPIIRYPEVAIIGMGAITKEVVAVSDTDIGIRSMMWVSLTFDHRVLDGLYGCGFLSELAKKLGHVTN